MIATRGLKNLDEFLGVYGGWSSNALPCICLNKFALALHRACWLRTGHLHRCESEEDVCKGDIVACFNQNKNQNPVMLGRVVHVGRKKLCPGHEDGTYGEVFVLPFNKTKVNFREKTMEGVCIYF